MIRKIICDRDSLVTSLPSHCISSGTASSVQQLSGVDVSKVLDTRTRNALALAAGCRQGGIQYVIFSLGETTR